MRFIQRHWWRDRNCRGRGRGRDGRTQINRVKGRENEGVVGRIEMNKARDRSGVCQRRGRQRGWERFLAALGSLSVLLPSSWTSLVAGVNYWDCTHTHADKCAHTGTWTNTNRDAQHTRTLTQPVIQGHLASLVWTSRERGRWCQTDRKTEMERAHTHDCRSTVGALYVINGIFSSCIVSSWEMDRWYCRLVREWTIITCIYGFVHQFLIVITD